MTAAQRAGEGRDIREIRTLKKPRGQRRERIMQAGEKDAWETLAGFDPPDVCARTSAVFDCERGFYRLNVFSRTVLVSPEEKTIGGDTLQDDLLLNRMHDYAPLSILGYLIHAKDIPPSRRLIKPSEMKGGQIYLTGSHVLPLHKIAEAYGSNRDGFLQRGRELGGEEIALADASVRLSPFPRVSVALLLWTGDEEFAARADLLADSTCELQLPPDIMWLTAMICVLAMH